MNYIRSLLIMIIFISFTSSSFAIRPLNTDNTNITKLGGFKIEEGILFSKPWQDGVDTSTSVGTSIKYGIMPGVDFGVNIPYSATDPQGMNDAVINGKIKFFEESETIPSLGIKLDYKLPSADKDEGLGTGYANYGARGIITKKLGPAAGYFNLGYTSVGIPEGADSKNYIFYGAALECPITENFTLLSELYGKNIESTDLDPVDFQVGANYLISKSFIIDGGVDLGLNDASSKYKGTVGLTVKI